MNNNDYDFSNEKTRQLDSQNERTITTNTIVVTLMRNVYMWMALALVITAFTSMAIANSHQLITTLFSNSSYMIALVVIQLVMVIVLTAAIHRISFVWAGVLFAIYAMLTGVTISSIFRMTVNRRHLFVICFNLKPQNTRGQPNPYPSMFSRKSGRLYHMYS